MRYRIPPDDECMDLLDPAEFDLVRDNEKAAIRRGRAKAWELHKQTGPSGQLRDLALGELGASIVLAGYTSSRQISALIASVSVAEGVQFTCKLERSLIDGAPLGVRVTLVAFTK